VEEDMRTTKHSLGVLALLVAALAPAAVAEPRDPSPVAQEDVGRVFDDLADQLRAMGQRWRGYVQEREPSGERPIISIMLSHHQELGLTTAQVNELERLRADFQREVIKRDAEMRVAEMDIAALLKGDPVDLAKVEAKIREVERARADLRIGRIRAIEQAKAQLTQDQRAKLARVLAEPWAPYPRWGIPPGRPAPPPFQ
jgi:Spy/CpxP family protein refolding chaperone